MSRLSLKNNASFPSYKSFTKKSANQNYSSSDEDDLDIYDEGDKVNSRYSSFAYDGLGSSGGTNAPSHWERPYMLQALQSPTLKQRQDYFKMIKDASFTGAARGPPTKNIGGGSPPKYTTTAGSSYAETSRTPSCTSRFGDYCSPPQDGSYPNMWNESPVVVRWLDDIATAGYDDDKSTGPRTGYMR